MAGGGLALIRAGSSLEEFEAEGDENLGITVVEKGLGAPLRQIAENAGREGASIEEEVRSLPGMRGYDAAADRMLDLGRSGVLDPTKVVRLALQNAVSIAGMILTTQTLVVEVEDEDSPEEESD